VRLDSERHCSAVGVGNHATYEYYGACWLILDRFRNHRRAGFHHNIKDLGEGEEETHQEEEEEEYALIE